MKEWLSTALAVLIATVTYCAFRGDANASLTDQATKVAPTRYEITVLPHPDRMVLEANALRDGVNAQNTSTELREVMRSLGSPIASRRWAYRPATPAEEALEKIDPFAPDVLLTKFITLTYLSEEAKDSALELLRKDGRLLSTEDHSVDTAKSGPQFFAVPADQYYSNQGYTQESRYQWGMAAMQFPEAWNKVLGRAFLGVMDRGVDVQHPDFAGALRVHLSQNFRQGTVSDYYAEEPNAAIFYGHGNHVTGIVGAKSSLSSINPSSTGVAGGCPDCGIVLSPYNSSADYAKLVMFLTDAGVQVINNSFGDDVTKPPTYPACPGNFSACLALDRAFSRGIAVVAAAGNDRTSVLPRPAAYDGVFAVGGTKYDSGDPRGWSFWENEALANAAAYDANGILGQYGTHNPGSNYGTKADSRLFLGPARKIISTFQNGKTWVGVRDPSNDGSLGCLDGESSTAPSTVVEPVPSPGYGPCTGTSMAAPHLVALIGLVRSASPLLTNSQTFEALRQSSSRVLANQTTMDLKEGWGMPRADYAVNWALSYNGTSGYVLSPNSNRLTPLFGVYSAISKNHLYSTTPQQITAAMNGTLKPKPVLWTSVNGFRNAQPQPLQVLHPGGQCVPNVPYAELCPPVQFQYTPYLVNPGGGALSNAAGRIMLVDVRNQDIYNGTTGYIKTSDCNSLASYAVSIGQVAHTRFFFPINSNAALLAPSCLAWKSQPSGAVYVHVSSLEEVTAVTYTSPTPSSPDFTLGGGINGYSSYPCYTTNTPFYTGTAIFDACGIPSAIGFLHATHQPVNGESLLPLFRLSWRCGDPMFDAAIQSVCAANPLHVSHRYANNLLDKQNLEALGYKFDGIEGYFFGTGTVGLPAGAVRLCRYYASSVDDWAFTTTTAPCQGTFFLNGASYSPNPTTNSGHFGWVMPNPLPTTTVPLTITTTNFDNGGTLSAYTRVQDSGNVFTVQSGAAYQAPIGQPIYVNAPPQIIGGIFRYFKEWSDFQKSTHSITLTSPLTLQARFTSVPQPTLDIDADGTYGALTDGILNIRELFGLTGTGLIQDAVGMGALRATEMDIKSYLNYLGGLRDVDGNGEIDALTDGLLALRYLFGITGNSLVNGAIGANATRTTPAAIAAYLDTLMP